MSVIKSGFIYRIEDNDGIGPYNSNNALDEMANEHNQNIPEYPSYSVDFDHYKVRPLIRDKYGHCDSDIVRFGFNTIESLKAWFNKYLEDLVEYGFNIAMYKADYMIGKSKKQIIFNTNTAKFIRNLRLSEIINWLIYNFAPVVEG